MVRHLHVLLAVSVFALAFYLSTGLGEVWPLAWLAPLPVLVVALEYSWRVAAPAAFSAFWLVFSPEGELVAEYDKRHLVPILEGDFTSGVAPGLFTGPGGPWGVAICKDLDFPAWSRAYGQRGVRFLAVPAWDFVRDGRLHARMAVVRGVENGFTIARSAQEGLVTVSDAYGRILSERSSVTDPLIVQGMPLGPGATIYTRYGDWFGWATLVLLIGLSASMTRVRGDSSRHVR